MTSMAMALHQIVDREPESPERQALIDELRQSRRITTTLHGPGAWDVADVMAVLEGRGLLPPSPLLHGPDDRCGNDVEDQPGQADEHGQPNEEEQFRDSHDGQVTTTVSG